MAKKSSASSLAKQMQQIAADAQVQVQKLANEATEKSFKYNAQEAASARQFNREEAAVQRNYNSQEAAIARNWEERMSNTSHQREVIDLKKAGLNPVLSANGGAQSYTTSSASAQAASGPAASASAFDASGSIGQLAGNLIQSRTGAYQADVSASATRAAAKQAAAATRYAASQQASAAKYAAAMAYQTQKDSWAWKTNYMKEEYQAKEHLIINTPVNNPWALADKYLTKAKITDAVVDSKWMNGITNFTKGVLNNPQKLFKDNVNAAKNDYSKLLTSKGVKQLNSFLSQAGLKTSKQNRNLLINSFVFGKPAAFSILLMRMPKKKRNVLNNSFSTMR